MPVPERPSALQPMGDRWTAADLEHLPDNGIRYEVLNGQLVVNAAPKPRHQEVLTWLLVALTSAMPRDMWVLPGVGVLIGDDEPIPDLIAGRGAVDKDERGVRVDRVGLAVEIVSASTTLQDRMAKPSLYAQAGIPNYWRIEINSFKGRLPGEQLPVLFAYALGENGEYELVQRAAAGAEVTLHAPFELTVDPATLLR
ncbi:Uma2 family endonuclease [Nocardia veterana]|uniref:Uma2 family endonuclease n=1 Tax=Nocardia veterana TaxID=132249 RepID=A0A7X6RGU8_9NOCA|nr:Uma2 family endonuclease [Nocardia veterana]NKY84998.1 Uma2 family endonuclease [Nocardia veterana]